MVRVSTLQEAIRKVSEGERAVVAIDGKDFALMSLDDLELFEEIEDRLDNEAADRALAEPGPSIPWERARKELGLDS